MLGKKLGELKVGDKLYVTRTKTPITLLEVKGNLMYFSNNIKVKTKVDLKLVYYTEQAIYCWKIRPIKVKRDVIVFKANELNTSKICKRQAPRVDLSEKDIDISIYEHPSKGFIGLGKMINISELGLRFKCEHDLNPHNIYVLKFKLDTEREIVSKVLYKTKERFYGVEFQPRAIQLEVYIKNAQIEKIKKRRLKE